MVRRPQPQAPTPANDSNVVRLDRAVDQPQPATGQPDPDRWKGFAEEGTPLAASFDAIAAADGGFDPRQFREGAKGAYERIVTAFAKGDIATLRSLLGDEVYRSFASAIEQRQGRGETQETTLVGIKEAEIVEADLTSNRMAEVTVRFVSELVNATRDKAGQLVGGNPNAVEETIDIWTFARNLRSSDPNWQLIATATPA